MRIASLEQIGGQYWEKNGVERVYFNHLSAWLPKSMREWPGVTLTGADDPRIPEMAARLKEAKLWFDVAQDSFSMKGLTAAEFEYACKAILAAVAALPTQEAML